MTQFDKTDLADSQHPQFPNVLATTREMNLLLGLDTVVVEADFHEDSFMQGHIPNARHWDFQKDLRNSANYEVIGEAAFAELMERTGISTDTHVILYGDNNNWFACWAYWVMKLYGHKNVRLMDGGIEKWTMEGRPLTTERALIERGKYVTAGVDLSYRASSMDVVKAIFDSAHHKIVDVRSKAEYRGELLGPGPGTEDTCAAAGHIPSAINIPWNKNCNDDGTFKSYEELMNLYEGAGIHNDDSVITCCALGERASLSWFVINQLLKFDHAMNYDRSMAYWSKLPNIPIITGDAA